MFLETDKEVGDVKKIERCEETVVVDGAHQICDKPLVDGHCEYWRAHVDG